MLLRTRESEEYSSIILVCSVTCAEGEQSMLCVVSVEGGPGTLQTIRHSLRNGTPVVLVDGFGRVTDLLVWALRYSTAADRVNDGLLKPDGERYKYATDKYRQRFSYIGFIWKSSLERVSPPGIGDNLQITEFSPEIDANSQFPLTLSHPLN